MNQLSRSIIHFSIFNEDKLQILKECIYKASTYGKIKKISSLYKKTPQEGHGTSISVSILLHTWLAMPMLLENIREIENENCTIQVLTYEHEAVISPNEVIPHPDLHKDAILSRCAAEVWGEYIHPVHHKSIEKIAAEVIPQDKIEFFMQGASLVDF